MMQPSNTFQRIPSPTPSGTQQKRFSHMPMGMEEEPEGGETIQKLRRLTSPVHSTVSQNGVNYVQVPSPKNMSQKASPKAGEHRRSTSPKLFPPPIQKFLNGKGPTTAADALRKLKVPSKKNHRENLEKMHLLGLIQSHEVESSLLFRRSVSPSASSYYSSSPICSPRMEVSPRAETTNTYDGSVGMQTSPQVVPIDEKPEVSEDWKNNYMYTQNTPSTISSQNNGYGEINQQQQYYQRNSVGYGHNGNNHQAQFQLNQQQRQQQQFQYAAQQQQQQQMMNQQQHAPYQQQNSWNHERQNHFQHMNTYGGRAEQEGRDRTTSFLGGQGMPFDFSQFQMQQQNQPQARPADNLSAVKSKAEDQLAIIQQLMQDKKKISSPDPNRDMMQHFKKRNSNPEIMMRSPEPQPLYPQGARYRNSLEMDAGFANNNMFAHQNFNNNNMFHQNNMQHAKGDGFQQQDGNNNYHNNNNNIPITTHHQEQSNNNNIYQKESTTDTSNQEMFGFFSNEQNHQSSSQGHYSGNVSEEFIDPDAFLNAGNPPDNEEFDMNITHTALSFMPIDDPFADMEANSMFPKFQAPGELPDDDI